MIRSRVLSFALISAIGLVKAGTAVDLSGLPLRFEENRGQAGREALFVARGQGYTLTLEATRSTLAVIQDGQGARVRSRLLGANPSPRVSGVKPLAAKSNYLLGGDPKGWITGVPCFERVEFREVYPGVDLVYYGTEGVLEYDFVVAPGADPNQIRMSIEGARLELTPEGDLALDAGGGRLRWKKPRVYQAAAGVNRLVEGAYQIVGRQVRFRVGSYDRNLPLVIDPVLSYATYYGGSNNDSARGFAVDSEGATYIAGQTVSTNLRPGTTAGVQPTYGGHTTGSWMTGDAFVTKLNSTGTAVVYSTYLGGRDTDSATALAADAEGNVYVTGFTDSTNFPVTAGALQTAYRGGNSPAQHSPAGDAFVTKINAAGNALVYSTYLGGELDDRGLAIAVDSQGQAYIAGTTLSRTFPVTSAAYQQTWSGSGGNPAFFPGSTEPLNVSGDGFVAKLSANGSSLAFCTYLGGSLDDAPGAIAVDAEGAVYVAGGTLSQNFPTTAGALQRTYGGQGTAGNIRLGDGFITKLRQDGGALEYSTYLGGGGDDSIIGMTLDSSRNVYVTGSTTSANFPTTAEAYQRTYRGGTSSSVNDLVFGDAFVSKLNPAGAALVFSTYLGGSQDDAGWDVVLDQGLNVYVAGHTQSVNFPVSEDAIQPQFAGSGGDEVQTFGDAFIAKLNPAGSALTYSSYYGGARDEIGSAIRLDAAGNGYLTGVSYSVTLPGVAQNAAQAIFGGGGGERAFPYGDAFVAKFSGLAEPARQATAVVNAANYAGGGVSPGEMVVVWGLNVGPAALTGSQFTGDGLLNTVLAQTRVLFDGQAAPLIYAAPNQIAAMTPYSVAGKTETEVQVETNGVLSTALRVPVVAANPGLFSLNASGTGPAAVLNYPDYSLNSSTNAAPAGAVVMFWGTGEGQTNPPGVDGQIATAVLPAPTLSYSVTIGGLPAEILYLGAAPSMVAGTFQMNLKIPEGLAPGDHPVVVTIGGVSSQDGLTVAVR